MPIWPYGSAPNVFPYGEKVVWPNGSALKVFPYGEKVVWPNGSGSGVVHSQASPRCRRRC